MTIAKPEKRIPYLDGLRGYSILAVVLDHLIGGSEWHQHHRWLQDSVANSTLGVRIFFVISGYLITTLLLREEDRRGKISIRGFYERRIARIFPAFYLFVAVMAILNAFHLVYLSLASFLAAITYTWNVAFFWRRGLGGWGDNNELFGHVWTLSIEEQFYLVWPSCLVYLGRKWSKRLAIAVIVLLPCVRLFSFFFLHESKLRSTLLARSAQDQILWGVLAAFLMTGDILERLKNFRYKASVLFVSLLLLFGSDPFLSSYKASGMEAWLVPTLQGVGTVGLMLWLWSGTGGILRRVLESWPAVQLGLLSYSLYIWQQPFTRWSRMNFLPAPVRALGALLVAALCYYLVEVPMRRRIRGWFSQNETSSKAAVGEQDTPVTQ